MRKLEGLSASPGIVVGPVFRYADEGAVSIPKYEISRDEAEAHWRRFDAALVKSRNELSLLMDGRNKEQNDILEAQLLMLSDPEFIPQVRAELERTLLNIESVLHAKVDAAASMLRSTGDAYLSERAVDIVITSYSIHYTKLYEDAECLFAAGVDAITGGNHSFEKRDFWPLLDANPAVLRPANFPAGVPGRGFGTFEKRGARLTVVNLQGREDMVPLDCPFAGADSILALLGAEGASDSVVIVDFHAESNEERNNFV